MGIFDTKRKQLEKLEREVLGNPTPQNMVSLAERYMAAGDEGKALDVARKAVEKFPDSEKCKITYQNVRKVQLQSEIQSLNKALRSNPGKSHYERLADLYHRDLGNRNKAFEIALEGLTKFPNSDGLHSISGLVRTERFHQDWLANDFTEAVNHLKSVLKINPDHYKARMGLARLYLEACLYEKARPLLDEMLRANPEDDISRKLYELMRENWDSMETEVDDALAKVEEQRGLTPLGQQAVRVFEPQAASAAPEVDPAKLKTFLQGFESMNGYKCSAILTRERQFVASHSRGVVPVEEFNRFVEATHQCSDDAAHKMDIGSFVSGELETSIGRVAMAECKNYIIGILADQPAKKEDLDAAVDKFVSFLSVS